VKTAVQAYNRIKNCTLVRLYSTFEMLLQFAGGKN
jgi:hypothetical protein